MFRFLNVDLIRLVCSFYYMNKNVLKKIFRKSHWNIGMNGIVHVLLVATAKL